jgi:hypothetical protein
MGEAKQRKLLAEKSGDNAGGRKPPPPTIAQELRRRIDSGEPIEDTRKWFMTQEKVWKGYFADQEPLVQSFIIDMSADFRIFLARKECPDKPLTEIVLETLKMVQGSGDAAKPTIDRLTKLIEPADPAPRSWAKGAFTVFANGVECFSWTGTKQDAIDVQKRCLEIVGALGIPPDRYAEQAASYLIAYGVPAAGDADRRPSGLSDQQWSADEALCFRYSILRAALREHTSAAGQRIEDVFVGRRFEIRFKGDQAEHRASMARVQQQASMARVLLQQQHHHQHSDDVEPSGGTESSSTKTPASCGPVTIETAELEAPCLLDPQDAVCIPYRDLLALAGRQIDPANDPASDSAIPETLPETLPEMLPETSLPETVYVPRIPNDAAEAEAMLRITVTVSAAASATATDPAMSPRTYAGYTSEEIHKRSI